MERITDTDEGGSGARWAFAAIASVVIHIVVIGVFLAPGCDSQPPRDDQSDSPEVAQKEDVQLPAEGDSVGTERSYTPPGSVLTPDASTQRQPARAASPRASTSPRAPATAGTSPAKPREASASMPAVYVVKQGDNLTKIARAHGTTAEAIAKANGKSLNAMNMLWVGQKIKLR